MKRAILTGNFDGLHLGHQSLLEELRDLATAQSLSPCVISFSPHTRLALHPEEHFQILSTDQEKSLLLRNLGFEHLILPFEDIKDLSPEDFIKDILLNQWNVGLWLMGFDHRFGKMGSGRASHATAAGIQVYRSQAISQSGSPISSSRVRQHLLEGDLDGAKALLGRYYSVSAVVEKGDQIGRQIGFPTANLSLDESKLLPPAGVYAGYALIQGERKEAVAHFGTRPTLDCSHKRFEVHLLDFQGDLYGQDLQFEFLATLRGVQRFDGLPDLQKAIAQDLDQARKIFKDLS